MKHEFDSHMQCSDPKEPTSEDARSWQLNHSLYHWECGI